MLIVLFYPVFVLGMVFINKIFWIMAIANHRLISPALEGGIFGLVVIVVLIRFYLH